MVYMRLTGRQRAGAVLDQLLKAYFWIYFYVFLLAALAGLFVLNETLLETFVPPLKWPVLGILLMHMVWKGFTYWIPLNQVRLSVTFCMGLLSLIIPGVMASVLAVSEGGFISDETMMLDYGTFLTSIYPWSVGILAVVSVMYISSAYHVRYFHLHVEQQADTPRHLTLYWSMPTLLASALVFAALQGHNNEHFINALDHAWLFMLSLISLLIAISLVFRKYLISGAFGFVVLQFFFAFYGYGISHLPYLLYPNIKLADDIPSGAVWFIIALLLILGLIYGAVKVLERAHHR